MKFLIFAIMIILAFACNKKQEPVHEHSHAENVIEESFTYDPFFIDVMSMHFENEMRLAKLGMEKTKSVGILNLSQLLLQDGAKDLAKLKAWRDELYKKVPLVEKDENSLKELEALKDKDFDQKFLAKFRELTSKGMEISKMGAEQNFEPAIKTYADEVQGRLAERLIGLEKMK